MGVAERDWFRERSNGQGSASTRGTPRSSLTSPSGGVELACWLAFMVACTTLLASSLAYRAPLWSNLVQWTWPLDFSMREGDLWTSASPWNGSCVLLFAIVLFVAMRAKSLTQVAALAWYTALPVAVLVFILVPSPIWEEQSWESLRANYLDGLGFLIVCFALCLIGGTMGLLLRDVRKIL